MDVLLDGAQHTVHLEPFSIRAPGFLVLVSGPNGELSLLPPDEPCTYRGRVEGWEGSKVAATYGPRGLQAWIWRAGSSVGWIVEPAPTGRDPGRALDHIVRRDEFDPQSISPYPCELLEPAPYVGPPPVSAKSGPASGQLALGTLARIEIAFDSDVEYFVANGSSIAQTEASIEARVNAMSLIYEDEIDTVFDLTAIVVRTSEPDPYNLSTMSQTLQALRTEWNGPLSFIPRDTVHMFTDHAFSLSEPAGIAVGIGKLCTSDQSYSLSRPLQAYSFSTAGQVMLLAHEVGHICGACHCVLAPFQACDTDDCPDCYLMGLGYPPFCNFGIPLLGPVSSAAISGFLSAASCVSHDGDPSSAPQLSGVSPANVTVLDGGTITMTGTDLDDVLYVTCAGVTWNMNDFTIVDPGTIEFTAPTGTFLGTAACSVSGPGGQSGNVSFTYVETYPPKTVTEPGDYFVNDVVVWTLGGRVGHRARVLLSTDPTTTLINGWPVLANGDVVQNGTLDSLGLGSYTRTLTSDLIGHDVYVQFLMNYQGQFEAASNITVISVIQ